MKKFIHVISKSKAIQLGVKRYFSGLACANGHFSERYICGNCAECARLKRESNREKNKRYAAEYRAENPEKIKESNLMSTARLRSLRGCSSITDLSQDTLKTDYTYDPCSGAFYKRGVVVGSLNPEGYVVVSVGLFRYLAHRLAWFYVYGYWPNDIDHINGVRDDNRLSNIRDVSRAENNKNQGIRLDNKSGFTGVSFSKLIGKWHAQISVDKKRVNLGYYDCLIDAVASRIKANRRYGFHENHGDRRRSNGKKAK